MSWTKSNFPGPVKGLSPAERNKAIRLANQMIEQRLLMERDFIIAIAISRAREWASERSKNN